METFKEAFSPLAWAAVQPKYDFSQHMLIKWVADTESVSTDNKLIMKEKGSKDLWWREWIEPQILNDCLLMILLKILK